MEIPQACCNHNKYPTLLNLRLSFLTHFDGIGRILAHELIIKTLVCLHRNWLLIGLASPCDLHHLKPNIARNENQLLLVETLIIFIMLLMSLCECNVWTSEVNFLQLVLSLHLAKVRCLLTLPLCQTQSGWPVSLQVALPSPSSLLAEVLGLQMHATTLGILWVPGIELRWSGFTNKHFI